MAHVTQVLPMNDLRRIKEWTTEWEISISAWIGHLPDQREDLIVCRLANPFFAGLRLEG